MTYKLIDRSGCWILGEFSDEDIEALKANLQLEYEGDTDFYVSNETVDALTTAAANLDEASPERASLERLTAVFEKVLSAGEKANQGAVDTKSSRQRELQEAITQLEVKLNGPNPPTDPVLIEKLEREHHTLSTELGDVHSSLLDMNALEVQWTRQSFTHALHVEVVAAKDLAKADIIGKSDPYARVELHNKNKEVVGRHQSKYIPVELNPVWNYRCSFLAHVTDTLVVDVYDHDTVSSDDFLGKRVFRVKELPEDKVLDGWYPLEGGKKGEVHVRVELRELKPLT